jgi:hypothetical protein
MTLLKTPLLKSTFGSGSSPQWKGSTFQIKTTGQTLYGVSAYQTATTNIPWQLWSCSNSTTVNTMLASGTATPGTRQNWFVSDISSNPVNLPTGYYLLVFQHGNGYMTSSAATDGINQTDVNSQLGGYDNASAPTSGGTISGNAGPYMHEISLSYFGVSQNLAPDAIITQTSLTGAVTTIQDDPESPDANWMAASSNTAATTLRVSFPTPTLPLKGSQFFEVLVRRNSSTTGTGAPTVTISLRVTGGASDVIAAKVLTLSTTGDTIAILN